MNKTGIVKQASRWAAEWKGYPIKASYQDNNGPSVLVKL